MTYGNVYMLTYAVLQAEIETCMRLLGVEKISDLGPKHVSLILHNPLID
jgi:isopentenyl diphosphate isomerase/L-lactate dehydrogenase-like FMN-dependent dehydrogenase